MSVSVEEVLGVGDLTANLGVTTGAATLSTDHLLAIIGKDFEDNSNVGPPTTGTWTSVVFPDAGTDQPKMRAWIRQAGTSGAITVSHTNNVDDAGAHLHVYRLRGVDLTTPVLTSAPATGSLNAASMVAPSLSATALGVLISAWIDSGRDNVIDSIAQPGDMTLGSLTAVQSDWSNMLSAYKIISSTGATGTKTAVPNATEPGDSYAALSILLQEASGAGGGNPKHAFLPFFNAA